MESEVLGRDFYARATATVARDLLGKMLAIRRNGAWWGGSIVETEAYLGHADAASHSSRGPTPRSSIMFGPPGMAYVYFIYGMHHCLNAVTEAEGIGAAVLIRALLPEVPARSGVRSLQCPSARLRGPGLVCRQLGVTLAMNGWDLVTGDLTILDAPPVPGAQVVIGQRVGISRARDLPLSFRVVPAAPPPARDPRY
ncbi:MAG: DNA-3-methyladenine glycosylase [Candidatus Dormibacteria bacterium]